jgi:UDP-glucose 4-epimerase
MPLEYRHFLIALPQSMTETDTLLSHGPVLVTGGNGFIGRWAVEALKRRGADLHLAGRNDPDLGVPFHAVDLLDAERRRGVIERIRPALLLHGAWFTRHRVFWDAPANLDWLRASLDLTRRFAECGGKRLAFVGTCAEYDWTLPSEAAWREDRPVKPATLYGEAKASFSCSAQALAAQGGFSFAWARVFGPIGIGEKAARLAPSLIRALLAGERATTGPGDLARDFMDARDAGAALSAIALSSASGPVNLGSGRGVTIGEIATRLGQLTGRPDLVGIGERPARDGEPASMIADIGRLRDEVGFVPSFSLDQTLRDAVAYWRAQIG